MSKKTISEDTKKTLFTYPFPGNIRELKAMMELACVMTNIDIKTPVHLNINIEEYVSHLLADERTL